MGTRRAEELEVVGGDWSIMAETATVTGSLIQLKRGGGIQLYWGQ